MKVEQILPAGTWVAGHEVDRVLIDFDRRFRRRIVLTTVAGTEVLIDLPQAVRLKDGDGLQVSSGIVRVCAQAEDLMEIHSPDHGLMIRLAWHLGNRHLPMQLQDERIRIRADHVIAEMIEGQGGHITTIQAPFNPEAGAYTSSSQHHHHHGDDGLEH